MEVHTGPITTPPFPLLFFLHQWHHTANKVKRKWKKIATLDSGLVDSESNANGQLIVDYGSNDLYLEQSSDHLVLINRPIKHLIVLMLLLVQERGTSAEQFMSIFTTEKIYPEIKWCNYCSCKNKGLRQLIYALMRTNDKKYHRMMYNKMLKIKICLDFFR